MGKDKRNNINKVGPHSTIKLKQEDLDLRELIFVDKYESSITGILINNRGK